MNSPAELMPINHKICTRISDFRFILCLRILGSMGQLGRKIPLSVQVESKQESTNESSY